VGKTFPSSSTTKPWRIPATVLALLAIAMVVWRVVHHPATNLDPNLLAVASFDVRGATLES
jgi:hypothetical protein